MGLYDIMSAIDDEVIKLKGIKDILRLMAIAGENETSDIQLGYISDGIRSLETTVSHCIENFENLSNCMQDYIVEEKEKKSAEEKSDEEIANDKHNELVGKLHEIMDFPLRCSRRETKCTGLIEVSKKGDFANG